MCNVLSRWPKSCVRQRRQHGSHLGPGRDPKPCGGESPLTGGQNQPRITYRGRAATTEIESRKHQSSKSRKRTLVCCFVFSRFLVFVMVLDSSHGKKRCFLSVISVLSVVGFLFSSSFSPMPRRGR